MTNIGRNDPCHCGSGKKYKACCLDKDEAKAREARAAAVPAATEEASSTADASNVPRERPTRQANAQPWKRSQAPRGVPRFTAPRRSGGS